MSSLKSSLSYLYRKRIHKNRKFKRQLKKGSHGNPANMIPPVNFVKEYGVQIHSFKGRPSYRIQFYKAHEKPVLLYFHGGTFLTGLAKKQWSLLDQILSETGMPMVVVDYPLIPEHTGKKIVEYCLELYEDIISECPKGIIFMGDSAGANLALTVAQQARDKKISLPKGLLFMSPFLDISGENPVKNVLAAKDPLLDLKSTRYAALLYAGSRSLEDPLVSPVYGSMKELPKFYVWTGTNDTLYADALLLKEKLHKEKVPYHIYTYPNMVHNWMFDNFRESKEARKQILKAIEELT